MTELPRELPEVDVFAAGLFYCPECDSRNIFREIKNPAAASTNGDHTAVPATTWPESWRACKVCWYELSDEQARPARPMAPDGGVVLSAWYFECGWCRADAFCDITIYQGDGEERPPSYVACNSCRSLFFTRLKLLDDGEAEESAEDETEPDS